jgi:tetratricopeptide (TPR) repeat protein
MRAIIIEKHLRKTFIVLMSVLSLACVSAGEVTAKAVKDDKQEVRDQIRKLCNQAVGYEIEGPKAQAVTKEAYDLAVKNFGKDSPEMVWPEFATGVVYNNGRDSTNAVIHFERARDLALKFPRNPCMSADSFTPWLFKSYIRSGKVQKANVLIASTLTRLEKQGKYKELQDLAMQYAKGGHCDEAIGVMERVVRTCEKTGGQMIPVLQQQIMVYIRCRRYKDSIPYIEKRTELIRQSGDMKRYADSVLELARMHDLAEQFQPAAKQYQKALQLFKMQKRDKYETAKVMTDYARLLSSLNRTRESDALKREAEILKFGDSMK